MAEISLASSDIDDAPGLVAPVSPASGEGALEPTPRDEVPASTPLSTTVRAEVTVAVGEGVLALMLSSPTAVAAAAVGDGIENSWARIAETDPAP